MNLHSEFWNPISVFLLAIIVITVGSAIIDFYNKRRRK